MFQQTLHTNLPFPRLRVASTIDPVGVSTVGGTQDDADVTL